MPIEIVLEKEKGNRILRHFLSLAILDYAFA
jgi:hypothetical protein